MELWQELLAAKDTIIKQQEEQITLLGELAEQRRLAYLNQCKELAEHRELNEHIRKSRMRFFCWLMLENVWPFKLWYHRFD